MTPSEIIVGNAQNVAGAQEEINLSMSKNHTTKMVKKMKSESRC
jgi:hypothetical protein